MLHNHHSPSVTCMCTTTGENCAGRCLYHPYTSALTSSTILASTIAAALHNYHPPTTIGLQPFDKHICYVYTLSTPPSHGPTSHYLIKSVVLLTYCAHSSILTAKHFPALLLSHPCLTSIMDYNQKPDLFSSYCLLPDHHHFKICQISAH